jgi:DNA-binding NarL/FixJ family response regulator
VVVDDHAAFRAAAERLLVAADVEVVGMAEDLAEARRVIERVRPDLVLLDVHLPDGNGFDLAREMTVATIVVMTSTAPSPDGCMGAAGPAVRGFIRKDELSVERLRAVLGRS